MIYIWAFLVVSILCVSGYIGGTGMGFSNQFTHRDDYSHCDDLLFHFWVTDGNEIVTGIFLFLAPACGLMIRFMVGYGRR